MLKQCALALAAAMSITACGGSGSGELNPPAAGSGTPPAASAGIAMPASVSVVTPTND